MTRSEFIAALADLGPGQVLLPPDVRRQAVDGDERQQPND
jgi:hypothetical protein